MLTALLYRTSAAGEKLVISKRGKNPERISNLLPLQLLQLLLKSIEGDLVTVEEFSSAHSQPQVMQWLINRIGLQKKLTQKSQTSGILQKTFPTCREERELPPVSVISESEITTSRIEIRGS